MCLYSECFNISSYCKYRTSLQLQNKPLSKEAVLEAISDLQALTLLRHLASKSEDSQALFGQVRITRKQYYSRITNLVKAGLVRRSGPKYAATLLGRVVCEATFILDIAINMHSISLRERKRKPLHSL